MNENSISHQYFGPQKISGHKTWEIITTETKKYYPQFLDISKARFALEDMYLLRAASQCSYKKDESIVLLQNTVKKYLVCIKKCNFASHKDILYAEIISYWYNFGRIYYLLHNLRHKIKL